MKRIGIITMHKVLNYGSALQAFATQHVVESMGYDASIIDYRFPNEYHISRETDIRRIPKPWYKKGIKQNIIDIVVAVKRTLNIGAHSTKRNRFERFYREHYKLTELYPSHESLMENAPEFDVYMTGSDQVWNMKTAKGDPNFFLAFVKNGAKRVAFSASFTRKPEMDITSYLKTYDAISMRERNGQTICEELIGRRPSLTLDPTLMLTAKEWKSMAVEQNIGGGYILIYMLDYAYGKSQYMMELAEYYQKRLGKRVVSVGVEFKHKDMEVINRVDCGPLEFLGLMADADMVITNSFHGTAFALNFGRPLIAIAPPVDEDDRIATTISLAHADNCLVKSGTRPEDVVYTYDVEREQEALAEMRNSSMEYLKNALSL